MTRKPNRPMERTPKAFGIADLGLVRRISLSSVHRIPFHFSSLTRRLRHCAYAKFVRTNGRPKRRHRHRLIQRIVARCAPVLHHRQAVSGWTPTEVIVIGFGRRLASACPRMGDQGWPGGVRDWLLTSHGRRQIHSGPIPSFYGPTPLRRILKNVLDEDLQRP